MFSQIPLDDTGDGNASYPCFQGNVPNRPGRMSGMKPLVVCVLCFAVCSPGSALNTNTQRCEICSHGTYKSNYGNEACRSCTGGGTTEAEGAIDRSQCGKVFCLISVEAKVCYTPQKAHCTCCEELSCVSWTLSAFEEIILFS